MSYIKLFIIFFKIGLFSIGGGLATLPLLKEELLNGQWMTHSEFINMIAISQATPGPIGINMATYAGFKAAGYLGGVIATTGIVAPSLIIIILIAKFMKNFSENYIVKDALFGIRPAAIGMIASACIYIFGNSIFLFDKFPAENWIDSKSFIFFIILTIVYCLKKIHPILILLAGALGGILIF